MATTEQHEGPDSSRQWGLLGSASLRTSLRSRPLQCQNQYSPVPESTVFPGGDPASAGFPCATNTAATSGRPRRSWPGVRSPFVHLVESCKADLK